jgi:uncharacterized protein YbjT (DUF2867 family)
VNADPTIAVLGASGLIGQAIASGLRSDGFHVLAVARGFTRAQRGEFAEDMVERPLLRLDGDTLAALLTEHSVDVLVNCVGVLQDTAGGRTAEVHGAFVGKILEALRSRTEPTLLVHLSIPGRAEDDRTPFSRTKREAEAMIAAGSAPFVIIRPGFVIGPAAYGGSALVRALAALPFDLSEREASRPLAVIDVADIVRSVALVAARWRDGERQWSAVFDMMERDASRVGEVLEEFRHRFGGPQVTIRLPSWLMDVAARAGDLAAYLGWRPPIRSTALAEMRRGVTGDPGPWIAATGIEPRPLAVVLEGLPATVQEAWFARLYLLKALAIGSLAVFWMVSGLVALTVGFDDAVDVLVSRGISANLAGAVTAMTSLADIAIGAAIAFRRSCRIGLHAGIALSAAYLLGATVVAPDLWLDPLGPLVKTVPAIVLMLVAFVTLRDR